MTTTYEVRRGAAVITAKPDAAVALSFAALHSHFPGQLAVYAVERREYLIAEPPPAVVTLGARGLQAGRGGR